MLCSCSTPLTIPAIGISRTVADWQVQCYKCHAVWRITAVQLRASDLTPEKYEAVLEYMTGKVQRPAGTGTVPNGDNGNGGTK